MNNPKAPAREWWILFRQWETIVMQTKEDILEAYPGAINPDVNLVHTIEFSAYESALAEISRLENQLKVSDKCNAEEGAEWRKENNELRTKLTAEKSLNEGLEKKLEDLEFEYINKHNITGYEQKIINLEKKLKVAVEAIQKLDCQCDSQYSGRDEAEYRARGCPNCTCEIFKVLEKLKE